MSVKLIVATHKEYQMPTDEMYLPVLVGAEKYGADGDENDGKALYTRDDSGDNISKKNKNYCELTGLYWAWKNVPADYIGLVHYRRHFSNGNRSGDKWERVIGADELESQLQQAPVLLPKKRHYRIETNYSQYVHAHHAVDLETTLEILSEKYPDYVDAWNEVMKKRSGHRFNMFVMRRDIFDKYCEWLFDVLFELENRLDISEYSENDARVFGFVGERLLDVWLTSNQIEYAELPYVFMEKQNWIVKGGKFVLRKLSFEK